nr:hypothetical protein [Vibrio cholerae]
MYQIEDGQAYIIVSRAEFDIYTALNDKGKKAYFDELTHNRPIYSLIED